MSLWQYYPRIAGSTRQTFNNFLAFVAAILMFWLPGNSLAQTSTISNVSVSAISGTASSTNPIKRVDLAIRNGSQYWNGTAFQAGWARVAATVNGNNWSYAIQPDLPTGTYNINSRVVDNQGNVQAPLTTIAFTADFEKPVTTITQTTASTLSGTASDNSNQIDRVELALRTNTSPPLFWSGNAFTNSYTRVPAQAGNTAWSYAINPSLPPGSYSLSSVAFDAAGNHQSPFSVKRFTIVAPDTTRPDTVISSADASQISGTATDNVAIDRVELAIRRGSQYWDGSTFGGYTRVAANITGTGPSVSWDYQTQLPAGTYAVAAVAFDTSGNAQSPFTRSVFTIQAADQVRPQSILLVSGTLLNASQIQGTASDNVAVNRVQISIREKSAGLYWDGTAFSAGYKRVTTQLEGSGQSVNWTYTFAENLPVGQYDMGVFAFDTAGNAQSPATTGSLTITGFVASTGSGSWAPPVTMQSIPVSAANLPDGKILTWAAYNQSAYAYGQDNAQVYTSIFDPATNSSQLILVTAMQHDMFCPGANILADGRVLVNGGSSAARTSIYDHTTQSWSQAQTMNIPRAYQGNTLLADGSVLTLGGSWKDLLNNMAGNKTAEVWTESGGWNMLNGIPADSMQTNDADGLWRADNHMWLFTVAGGKVLHAGPSRRMHLLDPSGNGSFNVVGNRADDADAMNGNATMYDIGKILTTGGSPDYENSTATNSAFVIETTGNTVTSRRVASMGYQRVFHNSVVLPNGEVIVIGGQSSPIVFSDAGASMVTELWNPATETFRPLASLSIPRTYHSVAILLNDGRVLAGGGGLCGTCATNHPDVEIFTPPYLLDNNGNALPRPSIQTSPANATHGQQINISTNSAIASVVLMRASVVTHSLNNAQRRVPLSFIATGSNSYRASIPGDAGIVTPGNYMLFVLNANGTPSQSRLINIQ